MEWWFWVQDLLNIFHSQLENVDANPFHELVALARVVKDFSWNRTCTLDDWSLSRISVALVHILPGSDPSLKSISLLALLTTPNIEDDEGRFKKPLTKHKFLS